MAEEREYKFDVKDPVQVKNGGVKGTIIARAPEEDRVTFENESKDGKVISKETRHPVNAYQVAFTGDNGRADAAWWDESMLELTK